MPFFTRDNLEFHYLDRGNGLPFAFQHGLGSDSEKIFALLALPPGFRLLCLDCRAHGKTRPVGPIDKLRFDSMADDLIALLDHLRLPQAIFGGTSMGAAVALNCALRHPQRVLGLVLLRPAWLDEPNPANMKLFGSIARLIREHPPKQAWDIFRKSHPYLAVAKESSDSAASLEALFLDPRVLETVDRLEQIPLDAPNRDRTEWHRITAPTLVMTTRADPIHPFEFGQVLSKGIPGARLEELTPKSINLDQYTSDLHRCLIHFLLARFQKLLSEASRQHR